MADKLITADRSNRDKKTYNLITVVSVFFIIVTAGFMIFQNVQNNEKLSQKEIVATAFAEQIQTMCSEQSIRDRYARMCSIAENYSEQSQYLDPDRLPGDHSPRNISRIVCEEDKTIIEYTDGSSAETGTTCNTSGE